MQLVTLGGSALRLKAPEGERLETARHLDVDVTGPECNAAVAAQRLGAEATWLSRLPDGPLGRRVAAAVRANAVDVAAEYVDGRQALTFYERGAVPRPDGRVDDLRNAPVESLSMDALPTDRVEAADVAYVSAATPATSAGLAGATAKFLKTAADAGASTALGVLDGRARHEPASLRETLEGLFPVVDVLVGSAAAVEQLFDRSGDASKVTHGLASEHGFETVALHRGPTAAVLHESTVEERSIPAVDAVDDTGALDAFTGAFLVGLAAGDVTEGLRRAVAADALVRTTSAPMASFTPAEVERVADRVERP